MAGVLLEEASPLGNIVAVVEDDDRAIYFYLHFPDAAEDDPQRMKVCWVRNRQPAPAGLDKAAMERGEPPLMPAAHCAGRGAGPPLDPENLGVVWFEECDGAALLEGDEILAIIPSWSGVGDFSGYARDCIGEGPFAWELDSENVMHERVRAAQDFWQLWDDEEFWPRWRNERVAALQAVLGRHTKHYSIDGGEFPPRALLRFDAPGHYVLITVGVSLLPEPGVERQFDDPSPHRRIELAAAVDRTCGEAELQRVGKYLSAQARYPWSQFSPLGHGHTMPCDCIPTALDPKRFNCVLFSQSLPGAPQLVLPQFRGDPTNVLWLLPISQRERQFAMNAGSTELEQRLARAGATFVMRPRKELAV